MNRPAGSWDRRLGFFDATMVVLGGIIGAGIFYNPARVAAELGDPGSILLVWAIGGAIALTGAISYAELGGLLPRVGGPYAFLREAFGPLVAFLYGWMLFAIIITGALAALALVFAGALGTLVPLSDAEQKLVAVALLLTLTAVNALGVRFGSWVQDVFTLLKVAAVLFLIAGGGLVLAGGGNRVEAPPPPGTGSWVLGWAGALVFVIFAYGGWQNVLNIAPEVKEPARNLPLSVLLGTACVIVLYLLVNGAYLAALSPGAMAASKQVAVDAGTAAYGRAGRVLVALAVMASTLGFVNTAVLVAPRVYFAMAADGVFFERAAQLHPRFRTPVFALALQAVWAAALVYWNTIRDLLDHVVFADWIFFTLTGLSLFVLRRKLPDAPRPYRAWGHPWIPALFVFAAAGVFLSAVISSGWRSVYGVGALGLGVVAYLFWRHRLKVES